MSETACSRPFRKLLVANRSEIAIRVFRTAHELGIRTVAIYSHEDRFALHRFKADEAYRVGKPGEPLRSYLDIDGIVALARQHEVDAIHPGYGFLSENADFAQACETRASSSSGRGPRCCEQLGDKVAARHIAQQAGVPVLSGSDAAAARQRRGARQLASKLGYPVIVKAAMGGGGRGMRVAACRRPARRGLDQARREAGTAFGSRRRVPRKVRRRGPPHRGATPRRSARQPGPSVRARLLGAAPASEGRRDRPGAQPRSGDMRQRIC